MIGIGIRIALGGTTGEPEGGNGGGGGEETVFVLDSGRWAVSHQESATADAYLAVEDGRFALDDALSSGLAIGFEDGRFFVEV